MHVHEIATHLINDTYASLWPKFAPEIILALSIMLMLIVRILPFGQRVPGFLMAIVVAGTALVFANPGQLAGGSEIAREELFTGMLVYDGFTVFMRTFLLVFAILFAVLTRLTRNPEQEDAVDFYCLVLGSTLGMCLMASANHLLVVFLAVEMASVPSYVLAGQLKYNRRSSEASLKYAVYGAGAAGIMLYGISLLAGVLNTVHLPTMADQLFQVMPLLSSDQRMVLALGGLMVMVGLAFKLSAVPYHFWCPDVFEGASSEVNAFLSVASKAAALALLVRVAIGFSQAPDRIAESAVVAMPVAVVSVDTMEVTDEEESTAGESAYGSGPLTPVRRFMVLMIGIIAIVTCTFGNLAAYAQTNIKRLMAYSTIAHAGYMMMAVPPAIAVATTHPEIAASAVSALALYAAIYLLMNLAAFAIIAFYRNSLGSEEISAYSGLIRRSPVIVVMFALVLFSLVGLPPLAGFLGKFAIFASITNAWRVSGNGFLLLLLIVGGINTAISLFYYLRVVKVMTIDPELDSSPAVGGSPVSLLAGIYVTILVVPIVTLLLYTEELNTWTLEATKQLF